MPSSERKRALLRLLLAISSAVLAPLGFVGFGWYPLAFVAWVPVLVAVRGLPLRGVYALGLLFGTAANLGGYYWVAHLMHEFAGVGWFLAVACLLLLCLYQGSIFALVLYLVRRAETDLRVAPVLALPVVYPALEFAYPQIFPANYGTSLYAVPILTQIADVTGVLGLTALLALVNGAVYELVDARLSDRRFERRRITIAAGVVLAVLAYGAIRIPMVESEIASAPKLKVALIQTNLGAGDKSDRRDEFILRHQEMSLEAVRAHPDLDLVVWPESAYNRYVPRDARNLAGITREVGVPVIFGAITFDRGPGGERQIYNTAVMTSSTGDVLGMFDKIELLVFGETLPFIERFPSWKAKLRSWFPRTSVFSKGRTWRHLEVGDWKLMPMICYEDIIPSFVRAFWERAGPAHMLVNVTNDSWYGDSHQPMIHFVLASFRSIETRRSLVRSTNTGISGFVDPVGRIQKRTGQWTKEVLVGEVPMITSGSTPIYLVLGDFYGWLGLGLIGAGWYRSRKKRSSLSSIRVPRLPRRRR